MRESSFKDNEERWIEEVIDRLSSEFGIDMVPKNESFSSLVRTILSQNTNRRNTRRAFENLTARFNSPTDYKKADIDELEELIRPAGLYRSKSKTLKKISEIILEEYQGDLESILEKPDDEAREDLMAMPGVGPKTADCVLLFAGGRDVLPVDTHVSRIAKRLAVAALDDDPEEVKNKLESVLPENKRGIAHLLMIELGRRYCKARNPDCESCVVEGLCPKIGIDR